MGSVLKSTRPNIKVSSIIDTQDYTLQYIWVVYPNIKVPLVVGCGNPV